MKTQQILMAIGICLLCAGAIVTSVLGQSELQRVSSTQNTATIDMSQNFIPTESVPEATTSDISSSTQILETNVSSTTYETQSTDTIPQ